MLLMRKTRRTLIAGSIVCVVVCFFSTALADGEQQQVTAFLEQHCLDCHAVDEPAGGLSLAGFRLPNDSGGQDTSVGEKIVRRLRARQMPPPVADRPTEQQYGAALSVFEDALDDYDQKHGRPGKVDSIRRMTRAEYQNAIRDLVAVNINAEDFLPADQSGHGFDNIALGEISPLLLNRYVIAAEKIARIAMGGKERTPGGRTVRMPADRSQDSHVQGLSLIHI